MINLIYAILTTFEIYDFDFVFSPINTPYPLLPDPLISSFQYTMSALLASTAIPANCASPASKDDSLERLEYLSLLSKLCSELETHLGFADKILAEYITEIGRCSGSVREFDAKLKDNGAEMPDYLVRTLFTIIHAILPPRRNMQEKGVKKEDESETRRRHREREEGENGYRDRDNEPKLYKVYKGRVSRVMDAGCFVQLTALRGKEGLVHVSQIATRRIASAKDVVKRGQEVYVKVISVSGQKLSLSMCDVDQNSGKDLLPLKKRDGDDGSRVNPLKSEKDGPVSARMGLSGIKVVEKDDTVSSRRPLKRMSSAERWEEKQLIAAGILRISQNPSIEEEGNGLLYQEEGAEEEPEIELNDDEPEFLQGLTRCCVDMSPVKILKNPEGSLARAAALQSALIKERREV